MMGKHCAAVPSGEAGGAHWHYACGVGIYSERMAGPPAIGDCLVDRPKPFRLTVWEPLLTKAPGPHLATPHCCYINTVIFYLAPYVQSPWVKLFRGNGRWMHNGSPGHFEEWEQVETRLTRDDRLEFEGEIFERGSGRVLWTHLAGRERRWWMLHGFRRVRAEAA